MDAYDRHLLSRYDATEQAALEALRATFWICSDGHRHRRPARFTMNRLITEVNRRNPRNDWDSATIWLGVDRLKEKGVLKLHKNWDLSVAADEGPTGRDANPVAA